MITKNGTPVTIAGCQVCGTTRAFDKSPKWRFPDSGYWTPCGLCKTYRMFFRIVRGRVVSEGWWAENPPRI